MSSLRAVEWIVPHPALPEPLAIIRFIRIGPGREPYFRAVTWAHQSADRTLIGYWGSLEHAESAVLGIAERTAPKQWRATAGGSFREPRPIPDQKPLPVPAVG